MKKKLKKITTDKEVKDFLKRDLSEYINNKNFKKIIFEFELKDKIIKSDKRLKRV